MVFAGKSQSSSKSTNSETSLLKQLLCCWWVCGFAWWKNILSMASIHHYFARKQVGDTQKRGKPEMRSSCRNSLDSVCTARPRRGPAADVRVSPTSDTCQSVAILRNRCHSHNQFLYYFQWTYCATSDAMTPFLTSSGSNSMWRSWCIDVSVWMATKWAP